MKPYALLEETAKIARTSPVIPVLTIHEVDQGLEMCRALVRGGLRVLEITLRTPVALEAIRHASAQIADAIIGAGTLREPAHIDACVKAGAKFLVSPGVTPRLLAEAAQSPVAFLPGCSTASEAMTLFDHGFRTVKFFPAEAAGGTRMLSSLAAPLGELNFCPTGGIDLAKAPSYLALKNVVCIGGSWMVPADALKAGDFARIEKLASEAAALRG